MVTDSSGNFSAIWRPYHYVGLELAQSIYSVALDQKATGQTKYFNADVVSLAKKNLNPGDTLDGEGGYCARGRLTKARISINNDYLPLGLTDNARVIKQIKKDQFIKFSDVEIDYIDEVKTARDYQDLINEN